MQIGTPNELGIESKKVVSFFKDEWSRPIALGDITFYQWQFIDVPYQNHIDNCCVAIDENKNILGVMGVNNRIFIENGNEIYAAELTTWIVKEEYRSKGIGPKMIDFLTNKYEVLIGMGISNDALPVYLRKGFKYLKAIPRYMKVLDWSMIDAYAEYHPIAKKVDRSWNKQQKYTEYTILDFNKTNLENIFTTFSKNNNLFSRNYSYIKWRYLDHPTFKYTINLIRSHNNGGNGVFIATREETTTEGLKILHIMDLFGDNKDIDAAIVYSIDVAKEKEIPIIDFFNTNSNINSFFIKNGWFSAIDNDFFKFPHLFQPIELRNPTTTSMIYWAKSDSTSFYNTCKLYLTKQDADFDRPVLR